RADAGRQHRRGAGRAARHVQRRDRQAARRGTGEGAGRGMSDELESWIGHTRTQAATLEPEIAVRYAAAFGSPLDVGAHFPPLGHWAYFNDAVEPDQLGAD